MTNTRKAVIYARVSSKEQEQEGFSIPAQLRLLRDYAKQHEFTIVKEFVEAETAKRSGRSMFSQMLDLLSKQPGEYVLLCEKTDRLYRNWPDAVKIDDLRQNGLTIHFVKQGLILSRDSRPSDTLVHDINTAVARHYIENLRQETRKGMVEKAERGIFPSLAPLGYLNAERVNGNEKIRLLELDQTRAPIIEKMFRLYATGGYSLQRIVEFTKLEGLRSKGGRKLGKAAVEAILKNPLYYGDFRWNGKLYRGTHQPIISKSLYDAVQQAFANHHKPLCQQRGFSFTGLLACGKCGCAITAEIKKGRYIYYHCTGFKGKCGNTYIREETLEQKFGELLKDIEITEERLEAIKAALHSSHRDEKAYRDTQIAQLQAQYTKLQQRLDRLFESKLDGEVSSGKYDQLREQWQTEQDQLLRQIEQHQNANRNYLAEGIRILELANKNKVYRLYLRQTSANKRKLLNFVLSNCTFVDGNLTPTYRKPFDLLVKRLSSPNWLPRLDSNQD